MVRHKKIYVEYFDIGEQDLILCESCHSAYATQVHHLTFRSQGGKDEIENLMGLCHICHERAHRDRKFNEELRKKHLTLISK